MINIPSTFKISFRALRVNKMRSALTMLGIVIGVGAVIAMVAVGTGASRKIAEQISSMGSNLLIILPGATTSGGVRMGAGTQPTLTTARPRGTGRVRRGEEPDAGRRRVLQRHLPFLGMRKRSRDAHTHCDASLVADHKRLSPSTS